MFIKKIFNPFAFLSEKILLAIGLLGFIVLCSVSYCFKMAMDGIWHIGYAEGKTTFQIIFQNALIAVVSIVSLGILAKIYNKKSRWIDIVNTVFVSFVPNIFVILISGLPYFNEASEKLVSMANNPNEIMNHKTELFIVLISSFCIIPFAIYSVILLYNGFKTATNMKSWQQISIFFILTFILNLITQFSL
ncbi:MAG: hypothetical protein JST62_06325 [Bacteroidetes bacterium]|nr:hypothetical protein [Bacteroidota bacterium]